ncbi:glycosyltransferase family 2 protein [Siphonobacter sp. SORGH_AS_0500]|uniref:glycosyltransferase family 2 protein n=1 Tax=Siphonobacter sp. SORGH_AS_0500 TaxID=1864824 RepID=UPI002863A578|nr:glycosyltransferase family 2 protein [Siphonobacter sp. SORGH_AS_0500]MDR6196031.1 glycosyltransferase involved in cell wall biosynthesis [Siphonobacter sp. SORGH_AS_0500]
MNELPLSVVICTYNRADLIGLALEDLTKQTLDTSQFEIIVIDNNSKDNTSEVVRIFTEKYPHIHYFFEGKPGRSIARNRGWREAKGTFVAYLDDDIRVDPQWAMALLGALRQQPQPLAVGGLVEPWYAETPPKWFIPEFELRSWGEKAGYIPAHRAPFGFAGGNMGIARSLLEKYRGFQEELGGGGDHMPRMGEETDLFFRIYKDHQAEADRIFWFEPAARIQHWTPARNWQVPYRMQRSHASGAARAWMMGVKPFSVGYWRVMAFGVKSTFRFMQALISSKNPRKTEWIKYRQTLAYLKGFSDESIQHGKDGLK